MTGSLPRRRLPPSGLPRRREPRGRELAGRRQAQGRGHRALSLRRAHGRPAVRWTYTARRLTTVPAAVADAFPAGPLRRSSTRSASDRERPVRGDAARRARASSTRRASSRWTSRRTEQGRTARTSTRWKARSPTSRASRSPAARPSASIPRPGTSACGVPPYFADVKTGVDTEVVAVDLAGKPAAGRPRRPSTLTQVQWHSVRRAEGSGFYTWETERKEIRGRPLAGHDHGRAGALARAASRPAATSCCARTAPGRGRALHDHARRRSTRSDPGYTAWERYDHNRIDLVPEKKTYRPGDTARIMIKSPWERATRAAHDRARGHPHAPHASR